MANFQVLDAYGSVITIQSSTFSGAERQIIGGNLNITGNPSISGTVNIGNVPSVNATVVNIPSVNAVVTNVPSVNATIVGNPSISGTVNVGNPISSVFVVGNPSISGTVNVGNPISSVFIVGNSSISGTVNIGTMPGSVVSFQGTNPWVIGSIVGTYAEDAGHTSGDKGLFSLGVRNDTVASFVSADLDYAPIGVDSAGRSITKPFAAEESRIEGYISLTSSSVTTLVAAAGTGLRNYITDVWLANTGSVANLVTFQDGAGSILGYTIAPSSGGSNLIGMAMPIRTGANATFDIKPTVSSSTLYATVKGFKAP